MKDIKKIYCDFDGTITKKDAVNTFFEMYAPKEWLDYEKLWIEGNTSIAYSDELSGFNGDLFSLTFLPHEMKEAWEIPLKDVKTAEVSWFPAALGGKLSGAACFPFAQHMLSDSPGRCTNYGSKAELQSTAEKVNFKKLKTFSNK